MRIAPCAAIAFIAALSLSCRSTPGAPLKRAGDEISVAGELIHSGTRVVLWSEPGGYDAYRPHCFFEPDVRSPSRNADCIARYGSWRRDLPAEVTERVRTRGWTVDDLAATVSQVVIHFDACGTSKRCFEVLHDIRGLSCHFLIDLDGTVYQTLDVKERAWHAAGANDRSIGIEIANIGAFADPAELATWYKRDNDGVRIAVPEELRGHLAEDAVFRPRQDEPVHGRVQEQALLQYDFTEAQYRSLEKLLVTLCRVLPRIHARVPRDANGEVLGCAFDSDAELHAFEGLVGHSHVTKRKIDPGPAFDWDRVVGALRAAGVSE